MNLALYSSESAGNKDLMGSVRRIITTELQKLVLFLFIFLYNLFNRLLEAKRPPNRNNYFGTFQWNRVKFESELNIKISIYFLVES